MSFNMRSFRKAASRATGMSGAFSKKGKRSSGSASSPSPFPSTVASHDDGDTTLALSDVTASVMGGNSPPPPLLPEAFDESVMEGSNELALAPMVLSEEEEEHAASLAVVNPTPEATTAVSVPPPHAFHYSASSSEPVTAVKEGFTQPSGMFQSQPNKSAGRSRFAVGLILGAFLALALIGEDDIPVPKQKKELIDRLEDRLAIQQLMKKYAIATSSKDWDALRSVVTNNTVFNYENVGGIWAKIDEAIEFFDGHNGTKDRLGLFGNTQHFAGDLEDIVFEGETKARLAGKVYNPLSIRGIQYQPNLYVGGSYSQELIKVEDEWKSIYIEEDVAYGKLVFSFVAQMLALGYVTYKAIAVPASFLLGGRKLKHSK